VPLGIALAVKLIPPSVLAECRVRVAQTANRPTTRIAVGVIVGTWLILAVLAVGLALRSIQG
jgi:hypothetical protein